MTAVEWLVQQIDNGKIEIIYSDKIHSIKCLPEFVKQAIEIEKQQSKQTVLNLLYHELGHDDTARWIAERLEAGEIDVNDL